MIADMRQKQLTMAEYTSDISITTVQFMVILWILPVPYHMTYGALNIFDGMVRVTVRSYDRPIQSYRDEKILNYTSQWYKKMSMSESDTRDKTFITAI